MRNSYLRAEYRETALLPSGKYAEYFNARKKIYNSSFFSKFNSDS